MTDKTDTGGSAFPRPLEGDEGMDLLDYYAGQEQSMPSTELMEQIFAEMKSEGLFESYQDKNVAAIDTYTEMIARYRFRQAEAMIAEKRRREG